MLFSLNQRLKFNCRTSVVRPPAEECLVVSAIEIGLGVSAALASYPQ